LMCRSSGKYTYHYSSFLPDQLPFAGVGVIGVFIPLRSIPLEPAFDFSVIPLHSALVAWL